MRQVALNQSDFAEQPTAMGSTVVAAGAGVTVKSSNTLAVPNNQIWEVTFAGGFYSTDDPQIGLDSVIVRVGNLRLDPGNSQIPLPVQITRPTGQQVIFFTVQLQGIVLYGGDITNILSYFTNADAVSAHNVLSSFFVIRYLPSLLVSEFAVASLPLDRRDSNLDARLRNSRG